MLLPLAINWDTPEVSAEGPNPYAQKPGEGGPNPHAWRPGEGGPKPHAQRPGEGGPKPHARRPGEDGPNLHAQKPSEGGQAPGNVTSPPRAAPSPELGTFACLIPQRACKGKG